MIDLNSIRSAWTGIDPNTGQPDLSAAILFALIIHICDTIVITDEISRRYQRLFDTLRQNPTQSARSLNIIYQYSLARHMTGKVDDSRLSTDLPELSDETCIKDEDREFSRVAGISQSILVTFDGPLLDCLTRLRVKAMPPPEALALLQKTPSDSR